MIKLFPWAVQKKKKKKDKLFDTSFRNEGCIIRLGSAPAIKAKDGVD